MFAPNMDQMHVVDHVVGQPTKEKRNVLQESARIARGDVTDLKKLDVAGHDALIIPGEGDSTLTLRTNRLNTDPEIL